MSAAMARSSSSTHVTDPRRDRRSRGRDGEYPEALRAPSSRARRLHLRRRARARSGRETWRQHASCAGHTLGNPLYVERLALAPLYAAAPSGKPSRHSGVSGRRIVPTTGAALVARAVLAKVPLRAVAAQGEPIIDGRLVDAADGTRTPVADRRRRSGDESGGRAPSHDALTRPHPVRHQRSQALRCHEDPVDRSVFRGPGVAMDTTATSSSRTRRSFSQSPSRHS
jgi:hypothetical protein